MTGPAGSLPGDGIIVLPLTAPQDAQHPPVPAEAADRLAAEIGRLEALCFSEPWSEASLAASLEQPPYTWYAAIDPSEGALLGYAGLYTVRDEADITRIAVLPQFRRRGIGSLLLKELIGYAARRGIVRLQLEVRESNAAARLLYERFGFVTDGIRKRYYRHPTEDAVLMSRDLTEAVGKEN